MLTIPLLLVALGPSNSSPAELPAVPTEVAPLRFHDSRAESAVALERPVKSDSPNGQPIGLAAMQEASTPFGQQGSLRWSIHGGGGVDVKSSDNWHGLAGVGLSYFIIDDLSFDVELNGLYISQRGDDAWGANLNLLFRWHFIARDTWSLYFDGGAGMLGTTDHVPENGSGFNFTPQAGLGISFDVGQEARLMTGVRWHHISNANTFNRNPGRDSVMGYVGLSLPF